MAATVVIKRLLGTAPGQSGSVDITSGNTRLKQADNGTADANNPVPAVTTSYSYWASTQLQVTVAPSNGINNIKWYSDGSSFGTGLTCSGYSANATNAYTQATSAIVLNTSNYTSLAGAPVDVTTLTSGSPHTLAGSPSIGNTTGYLGGTTNGIFVFQLAATSSASPGTISARTVTWQYDET
jgi:hypothetical protein